MDADELVESLRRQGFTAILETTGPAERIEVRSPHEETSRLVADLHDAVGRWLPWSEHRAEIRPVQ